MPSRLAFRSLFAVLVLTPAIAVAQAGHLTPAAHDSIVGEGAPAVSPVLRNERSYRLIAASAPVAARLADQPALYAMQSTCRGAVSSAPPARGATDDTPVEPFIAIVVLPGASSTEPCESSWDASALAAWNGLSFGRPPANELLPARISLVVAGDTIAPLRIAQDPAFAGGRGDWTSAGERLRYDFPLEAFAPRADGWPATRILVWHSGAGYAPVEIDDSTRQRLAANYLAARVLAERGTEGTPVRLLPRVAIRPAVQQALYAAAAGRNGRAALEAANALGDVAFAPSASPSDAIAQLVVAELFVARGDTALAGALVEAARAGHPCLRAPAGASLGVSVLVTRRTAAGRCDMLDPRRTFLTTLVLPGFGHARAGNHPAAIAAAAAIIGTFVYGANQWRMASGEYDRYRRTTNYSRAPEYYDRANRLRSSARLTLGAGVGLLLGDELLSWLDVRRFNAKIRNDFL